MKSIHNYIVENKNAIVDSFETESGTTIYVDSKFDKEKGTNCICDVKEVPALAKTILKPGFQVFIDPTVFFSNHYEKGGEIDNPNILDKKKGLYSITDTMIILYRENENAEWKGFGENFIAEPIIEEEAKKSAAGIILDVEKPKVIKDRAIAKILNPEIHSQGLEIGDTIILKDNLYVSIYLDNKSMYWIRNRYVQAVLTNN